MLISFFRIFGKIICFAFLCTSCVFADDSLIVATWNIRINIRQDSINGNVWSDRRNAIVKIVQENNFDVLGVQEDYNKEIEELNSLLPDYDRVGFPNHENGRLGSFNTIFYRKGVFVLMDSGMFYLAEDETKPALGWNGKYIRSCTWASLLHRESGEIIWAFNTHLDYAGGMVERESAQMLVRKLKEIAGESTKAILMGDLNFSQLAQGYKILNESGIVRDGFDVAKKRFNEVGTFNNFDKNRKSKDRLDFIFLTNGMNVLEYKVLLDMYEKNGKEYFPSDHFPVALTFML